MQISDFKSCSTTNKNQTSFDALVSISPTKRIFFFFLILFSLSQQSFSQSTAPTEDKFILVIDPGHGGRDPGTIGKISKEKDVVLAISLKFGKYVEENLKDVKVIYTRKTDVYPELHERTDLANKSRADLFVSIHANANKSTKPSGSETYVMGLHKDKESLAVAQTENAVILKEKDYEANYGGFDPNSPESYIRISLEHNTYLELSLLFTANVQDQFGNRAMRKNRGVKQAGYVVLWQTTMPGVLIETGFLSNATEEKFLNTEHGQDLIASAIYRAFRDYKNEINAKSISQAELQKQDSLNSLKEFPEEPDNSGIVFKVQIASSVKPISLEPKNFKGIEDVEENKLVDSYKYTVGHERDYDSAYSLFKQVKKKIPDAFMVAFKDGEKISVRKARKETNNH